MGPRRTVFLLAVIVLLFVTTTPAARAAPGDVIWLARGDVRSIAVSAFVSPDADTVFATDELFGLVAYDASTGALICRGHWGRGNRHVSRSWALSPDGSAIYATGFTGFDATANATVAFDASTCERLWVTRGSGGSGTDAMWDSIAVSPDGSGVFVTGNTGNSVAAVGAYQATTGEPLWATSVRNGLFGHLVLDPDGERVYVTGVVGFPGDLLTVAYATADGEELWRKRYEGPRPSSSEHDAAIAVDALGSSVYVTGTTTPARNANDSRFVTLAYDSATGEAGWVRTYNGTPDDSDWSVDVVVDPDLGQAIVTGASGEDIVTVAYDAASGARLWLARHDVEGPYGEPNDMALDAEAGKLYVLGTVWGAGEDEWDDFIVLAYETATGAQSWSVRWGGPGELREQADAIAVDPGGERVYVAGSSADGEGSYDTVVIAFAAT